MTQQILYYLGTHEGHTFAVVTGRDQRTYAICTDGFGYPLERDEDLDFHGVVMPAKHRSCPSMYLEPVFLQFRHDPKMISTSRAIAIFEAMPQVTATRVSPLIYDGYGQPEYEIDIQWRDKRDELDDDEACFASGPLCANGVEYEDLEREIRDIQKWGVAPIEKQLTNQGFHEETERENNE